MVEPKWRAHGTGRSGQADRGYGVLLMIGLFAGFAAGLMLDEPSAGTLLGLGLGGLAAIALRLRDR